LSKVKINWYRLVVILVLAGSAGTATFMAFKEHSLRRQLDQEVLAYENLLSEKLQLEKQYNRLLSEWSMVKPAKVDSLRNVIRMRDQELARLSGMIRQLDEMVDKLKTR
jgi:hypothetical protein